MSNKIETRTEELAASIIQKHPEYKLELIDVEYVKERDWYLRVYIDKIGGVDLDDCQMFSEKLGALLDHEPLLDNPYILEVSSPGLDRALKKPRDFVREKGKLVDVTLYAPLNGQKTLTGKLISCEDQTLTLEGIDPLPMSKVAQIRLHINF